jgi:N-acetyl sugar amidotransferase
MSSSPLTRHHSEAALPRWPASGRVCARCVMDESDRNIRFDADGVCNHCHDAERALAKVRLSPEESKARLQALAAEIGKTRTAEGYDSIIGLSGGVDSSYTAWLAHKLGLRPLAVHLDNGWNSEIAVANIHNLVQRCGFDLVTLVIDWPEFRDLQRAFIKAGVVDIEMLSDHAIVATMFRLCRKHGIQTVLSGTNVATEHGMPRSWVWNKQDLTNIRAIHARYGSVRLKTFPTMGLVRSALWRLPAFGYRFVELLDSANYRKTSAIEELKREAGWREYGDKHHESVFTKFYQSYILPTKFGIDKRRVHLSALIRNAEITRGVALEALNEPIYDPAELRRDREFVLKKLGFSEAEFDALMAAPPVPHDHYRSDRKVRDVLKAVLRAPK